tara:strand:+ start:644 stop:1213 length:570 start_codon:yes stop_codon:yes gene_type:complete
MKRLFDVLSSALVMIIIMPIALIICVLIKAESKGPIFYKQKRNGKNMKAFMMYKFRSMKLHDETTYVQTEVNDPRITKIGKFLRKTSLDELPQLINIIRGEMSVVGPRPHALEIDNKYCSKFPNYKKRYSVKPGLTGLAQINGFRGGDDFESMKKRTEFDLVYMSKNSLIGDLIIIFKTIPSLFTKGIY